MRGHPTDALSFYIHPKVSEFAAREREKDPIRFAAACTSQKTLCAERSSQAGQRPAEAQSEAKFHTEKGPALFSVKKRTAPQSSFSLFQVFLQLAQPRDGVLQRLLTAREVQADQVVHRLAEEARARNGGHADLADHPLAELLVAPALELLLGEEVGDIDHDEVRACGVVCFRPISSSPLQKISRLRLYISVRPS